MVQGLALFSEVTISPLLKTRINGVGRDETTASVSQGLLHGPRPQQQPSPARRRPHLGKGRECGGGRLRQRLPMPLAGRGEERALGHASLSASPGGGERSSPDAGPRATGLSPAEGGGAHLQDAGALQQALPQVLPHPPAGPPVLLLILVVLGHGGEGGSTPRCCRPRRRYRRPPPSWRPRALPPLPAGGGRGGAAPGRKPGRLRGGRCRKGCGRRRRRRARRGSRRGPGEQVRPRPLTAGWGATVGEARGGGCGFGASRPGAEARVPLRGRRPGGVGLAWAGNERGGR